MTVEGSAKSDDGTQCAFFYGAQMLPEVFYSVCYGSKNVPEAIAKQHTFQPAILHGYCRRRVRYADYPGIVEDKDHDVFGTFATGLTGANMAKLDYFEGSQYVRKTVTVRLLDKLGNLKGEGNVEGAEREAQVYVFQNKQDLEEKEWDLEEFRREKLRFWTRAGYVFEDCDPNDTAKVEGTS
ncbi:AIG2-like family-domain-containing protein [Thermothelomyces heterothallicus CBS 202.75]|uniref:AIG2-like family-domain-containing protein n=1 Tax=Thermothelomyces heterothallicus CBS 202.75 TaxID=1149848 RepID=UPI0037434F96